MKRTATQNKQLHALLTKLGVDADNKALMVFNFTNGRTEKSSEMLYNECENLIQTLRHHASEKKEQARFERIDNTAHQEMRRGIFRLMYDCGFIDNEMDTTRKLFIVNGWIRKKMDLPKTFNELSTDELQRMTTQLRTVRRIYLERAAKAAIHN